MYYTEYGETVYKPEAYAATGAPMYDEYGNNVNEEKSIYVAHLKEGKKYIGETSNFYRRCKYHFNGNGSKVTQKYRPYRIEEIDRVPGYFAKQIETDYTKKYINKYGYHRVRGGPYTNSQNF